MFKKALADFDMAKLTKVEIVGKPEITRDGASAKVRVRVRLSPDREEWKKFAKDVRFILDKTATRRAVIAIQCGGAGHQQKIVLSRQAQNSKKKGREHVGNGREAIQQLERQLDGRGVLVALFANASIGGEHIQWEVFRVPDSLDGAIRATLSGLQYQSAYILCAVRSSRPNGSRCRLVYTLSDDRGNEILRTTQPVALDILTETSVFPLEQTWWLGPVWWQYGRCQAIFDTENTIAISQEDLGKVANTAVFLETGAGQRNSRY